MISIKSFKDLANEIICSLSKFDVGSSNASTPQLLPKLSARANLKTIDASIFYPIEHLPLISISVLLNVFMTSL